MNIALAVALLAMTSLALAMLLVPLLVRRRGSASRDAYNLAVYRDQLAEIERDHARGLLNAEQSEAARAEIGRRILALKPADAEPASSTTTLTAATLAILLLPVAAWALYWQLGSPGLPDQPFAERRGAGTKPLAQDAGHIGDIKDAVARLGAHLKEHPEDLTGWLLLGRSEVGLGQYSEGAEAYRHAVDLSGHRADITGDWGEALVLAAGGTVTPAARQAFEAGLTDKEAAPRSRYYLALARMQEGDVAGALKGWGDLAADSPADAEWLPLVRQRIAQASAALKAPGSQAQPAGAAPTAAADASPQERQAMINAMVERLAARLDQQPDDVEGWVRLGRSYMVLNQPDKAREAYARALKLRPDDPDLKQALAEAATAAVNKADAK